MKLRLSRRAALRGAGGVVVGLPWLEASASAAPPPKRLVVFHTPSGTIPDRFRPTGSGATFQLSELLKPLEPVKSDVLVLGGLQITQARDGKEQDGGVGAHQMGLASLLTNTTMSTGMYENNAGWANGISVDQEIVRRLAPQTKFKSLQLGAGRNVKASDPLSRMCFSGPAAPLPLDHDPSTVFTRVFGEVNGDPAALVTLRAQRRSVLDAVLARYRKLQARLGGEDRMRFDAHVQSLRELEMSLDRGAGGSCVPAGQGARLDPDANDNFPTLVKSQIDLLVNALACDLTRVATMQCSHAISFTRFTWLGIQESHHNMTHTSDSNTAVWDKIAKICLWHADQFAYLLQKMRSVREGNGTLLDNSVVLWASELNRGNNHTGRDAPLVLAGHAGGLETGRYLRFGTETPTRTYRRHGDLLVSLLNLMDVPATTFGNPAWCSGPLPGLV